MQHNGGLTVDWDMLNELEISSWSVTCVSFGSRNEPAKGAAYRQHPRFDTAQWHPECAAYKGRGEWGAEKSRGRRRPQRGQPERCEKELRLGLGMFSGHDFRLVLHYV